MGADKVKIGAVAWGLPGGGAYAPRVAKKAGLDGIQLELGSYEAGYPLAQPEVMEGWLEDRERYEIEYPALVLNDLMVHEFINGRSSENGKIAYEQIAIGVETAKKMGIERVMIPNFLDNLIRNEGHIENTRDALRYACELAAPKGILILTENALDYRRQVELLSEVRKPNLRVHFDTQNFKLNFGMDQRTQLEGLYPLMDNMLHVKDGINNPGERLLGQGNTNFLEQMKILKNLRFQGWLVTENYYNLLPLREAGGKSQMELLAEDINTIRSCV